MRHLKIFGVCIVVLIFGLILGTGIKITYESSTFKPYDWFDYTPIIANCYGEDFSEAQMQRAIDYWDARGHKVGFYEHNPPESICESDEDIWGFIILRKQRFGWGDGTLAMTTRVTTGFTIRSATISYKAGSQNLSLINEHELGHAFGYNHLNIEGHIMHPNYFRMGSGFWIP